MKGYGGLEECPKCGKELLKLTSHHKCKHGRWCQDGDCWPCKDAHIEKTFASARAMLKKTKT